MDDLTEKTDEELRDIMRASIDNQYVPSSIYHKAKQELEFRQQKTSNSKAKITGQLVKSRDGRKYIVEDNVKHYIPDSETKNALGFEGGRFVQLSDQKLKELDDGVNIESVKSPSTQLVRTEKNHDDIFAVFTWPETHRRHVPNPATLKAMGRRQDQANTISEDEMKKIPEKEALRPFSKWDPNVISDLVRQTSTATIRSDNIQIKIRNEIYLHIKPYLDSKDYFHSIDEAYKIVRQKLEEITGHEKATEVFNMNAENDRYHEQIFGYKAPSGTPQGDFLRGVGYLQLAVQFLRNEKSHELASDVDKNLALHYISLASLAYDLITRNHSTG